MRSMRLFDHPATVWLMLFAFGAAIHLLLQRGYLPLVFGPNSETSFTRHPLTNTSVAISGGLSVASYMKHLIERSGRTAESRSRIVIRGCFYGVYATTTALLLFFVLLSLFLAISDSLANQISSILQDFFLYTVGIVTYGLYVIICSLPFAAAYGLLLGAVVAGLVKRSTDEN